MTAGALPIEQRFVLDDADWELYDSLLRRVADRHVFITYDRGRLEMMSPSWKHDKRSSHIAMLIWILADEMNIPFEGGGSTTFRRADQQAGLEADQCFYVQNVDRVRGKDEIDLTTEPPPDLAIEVEISRRLAGREDVYARLGVPELWRDDGQTVRVFTLQPNGKYQSADRSRSFPNFPVDQISRLLEMARNTDAMTWSRAVRAWIRQHVRSV